LFRNAQAVLQNDNFFYLALLPGPGKFGAVKPDNKNVSHKIILLSC